MLAAPWMHPLFLSEAEGLLSCGVGGLGLIEVRWAELPLKGGVGVSPTEGILFFPQVGVCLLLVISSSLLKNFL